jgi:hypothetical protein
MHECRGDENARAKVSGKEEEVMWYREAGKLSCEDGEGAGYGR